MVLAVVVVVVVRGTHTSCSEDCSRHESPNSWIPVVVLLSQVGRSVPNEHVRSAHSSCVHPSIHPSIHPCQRRPYQPLDEGCVTKNCNGATRASDDAERSNILFSQRILNPAHHCANATDNESPLSPLPDGIASFERHTSGHCCVRSAGAMGHGLATRSRWKSLTEIPVA